MLSASPTIGPEIIPGSALAGTNQYQQTLAVNPLNLNWIAITCKTRLSPDAENYGSILCTRDGGTAWNAVSVGDGGSIGDPYCSYDRLGNLHLVAIDRTGHRGSVYQKSTNGGVSFSSPIYISGFDVDHPNMFVDPNSNSIYISGKAFGGGILKLACSHDSGATWAVTDLVTSGLPYPANTLAAAGAITAGGVVKADGTVFFPATDQYRFGSGFIDQDIYGLWSTDGGATLNYAYVGLWHSPNGASPQYGEGAGNAAVFRNTVYFLHTQPVIGQPTSLRMYQSTTNGVWSGPLTIYTAPAGFGISSMSLMINPAGVMGVSFYQTNNGVTFFDIYFIYSLDAGVTWSAPISVSSASSADLGMDLSTGQTRTPGQDQVYGSVDSDGAFLIPWSDARGGATVYTTYLRKITIPVVGESTTSPTIWSVTDAAFGWALTNNNLTAQRSDNNNWRTIRASTSKSSGRCYVEFKQVVYGFEHNHGFGFASAGFDTSIPALLGGQNYSIGSEFQGVVCSAGFSDGGLGGIDPFNALNDVVSFAIDFQAGKIWLAVNNSYVGGGNPTNGTSPWATFIPSTVGALFPAMCADTNLEGSWTIQTTLANQTYSAPSNFSPWG